MHLIQHLKQEPIARKTMILIATIILGIAVGTDAPAAGHVGGGGGFGGGHIGGGLGGGHFGGGFGDGFHDGHHRFGEEFRGGAYRYFPYDDYGYADDGSCWWSSVPCILD